MKLTNLLAVLAITRCGNKGQDPGQNGKGTDFLSRTGIIKSKLKALFFILPVLRSWSFPGFYPGIFPFRFSLISSSCWARRLF